MVAQINCISHPAQLGKSGVSFVGGQMKCFPPPTNQNINKNLINSTSKSSNTTQGLFFSFSVLFFDWSDSSHRKTYQIFHIEIKKNPAFFNSDIIN